MDPKRRATLFRAIAHNVRKHRIDLGLTQDELARHAEVQLRTVQRLEAGQGAALVTLVAIAEALEQPITALLLAVSSSRPSRR